MFSKTLFLFVVVYFASDFSYGFGDKEVFRKDYFYIEATKSSYKLHTTPRTFTDAEIACAHEGATLFYPENSNEAHAVIEYWKSQPRSDWEVFVGLTDSKTEGVFVTTDGKPISKVYHKWKPGEPNSDYNEEDCVELYQDGNFNDIPCANEYQFICKKSGNSHQSNNNCDLTHLGTKGGDKFFVNAYNYIKQVDSIYKIHTKRKNWHDAKQECAKEGASLFYPENNDEANAVISFWKLHQKSTKPGSTWVFVGISDLKKEGVFKTIDGKPISEVYNNWRHSQPDNKGDEDCVHLNQDAYLNDVSCDAEYSFICKKSPKLPDPDYSCNIQKSDTDEQKQFFRKDYDYIKEVESFYKIHMTPRKFEDARQVCSLEGASLFYPENYDEAYAVIKFWNNTHPRADWTVFVGLTDVMIEGAFETIDGKSISEVFNNWRHGEPNSHGGEEDCVELYRQGYLNDKPCDNKFRFICKKSLKTLEWNHACNMPDLDYTFDKGMGKCYKLHSTPLNWMDAHAVCRAEQSYLAVINNQLEADYLVNLTESAPKRKVGRSYQRGIYHIGFHNRLNNGWQTIRGTPINADADAWWDNNSPTDNDNMQCCSMFFNGRLNTIDCATKSLFICEHEVDAGHMFVDKQLFNVHVNIT